MITVTSYPSNNLNYSIAVPDSLDSNELFKYITIEVANAVDEKYIEVTYNGEVVTLLITDECRYDTLDVHFINRYGRQQTLTFFKKRVDTLDVTRESYESGGLQPLNGFHQYVDYNIQGRSKFKINSGFVHENLNSTYKELMLSSRVWIDEDDILKPVNLAKRSLEFKTRNNDKLINYEFEFDYSFNDVNNV